MRKTIIALSCIIALLLVGYTGFRGYQVWKQSHGLAMAKSYLLGMDLRNANLSLQQVLRTNPRNVEASRLMAGLLQAEQSADTLLWRERVLDLDPASVPDRLALAQCAVLNRDYIMASNTLAVLGEADRKTAAYHNVAGAAALIGGKPEEAAGHFSESVRLNPADESAQFNLAAVRLRMTNSLDMAEARIALQRVILNSTNAAVRNNARRELVSDALRFNDASTALNLSRELAEQADAPFSDKVLRLQVLLKTKNDRLKSALAIYQAEAATDPDKIAVLGKWEMLNLSPAEAQSWLLQLPAPTATNVTTEILVADCLLEQTQWHTLQTTLQRENWSDPARPWNNLEYMRHAYLARALRSQNLGEASTAEWVVAVKAATDSRYPLAQKENTKLLFELSASWNWNSEAEEVLWTVVNQFPDQRWAYPILRDTLISWHRTRSLMQLLNTMYTRDHENLEVKNDLAATAMLLGAQELKPYDLAREVYQKAPQNPYYASTYAFSLYLQGKYSDALKTMQQLSPKDLQQPPIAAYYGLVLKANGNKTEARSYLDRTSKSQLLPEEQALFERARADL